MTLGTPDHDYSAGMNDVDWTEVGLIIYVDDEWNPLAALLGNDTGIRLQQPPLVTSTDGSSHTFGMQFAHTVNANEMLYAQGHINIEEARIMIFSNSAGQIFVIFETGISPTRRLRSSSVAQTLTDGGSHHILIAVNGSTGTLDIYIDGQVVTYSLKDEISGTGYSGVPAGIDDTTVGNDIVNAIPLLSTGQVSRLKVWLSEFADATEALEEHNAELAAKGEGFDTTDIAVRRGSYYYDASPRSN